jgi:hypothetical protein
MRITETQKSILRNTNAKSKTTSADLAAALDTYPGPASRSAYSLVEKGLLKSSETKEGVVVFMRTAEGSKIAKKL